MLEKAFGLPVIGTPPLCSEVLGRRRAPMCLLFSVKNTTGRNEDLVVVMVRVAAGA